MPPLTTGSVEPLRVLLTGFGPFGGYEENPSWLAIKDLQGSADFSVSSRRVELVVKQVVVSYREVLDVCPRLHGLDALPTDILNCAYDICLHFGVGLPGRFAIETCARRFGYPPRLDIEGQLAPVDARNGQSGLPGQAWDASTPADGIARTPYDAPRLVAWLKQHTRENVVASEDAGLYLCEMLYAISLLSSTRSAYARSTSQTPCLFTHIPPDVDRQRATDLVKLLIYAVTNHDFLTKRATVLLLKEPRGEADPYALALNSAGYEAVFIAILEHVLVNEQALVKRLEKDYAGIIATSQRAVEALMNAQLRGSAAMPSPAFVIGPSTRKTMASLPTPPTAILGEESGTGENLALSIVRHFAVPPEQPLLYLTGDKKRDTLSDVLKTHSIPFEEIEVYRTNVREDVARQVTAALQRTQSPFWVAFFSPSGVTASMPLLTAASCRIAAIGPTTRDSLRQEWGIEADAVPKAPSAEALANAIANVDLVARRL